MATNTLNIPNSPFVDISTGYVSKEWLQWIVNPKFLTVTLSSAISASSGGTGQSSYVTGDILYASASDQLSRLADVATGSALISGGVGLAPSWGKIGLTTHVTGILQPANGGTGIANTGTITVGGNVQFSGPFTTLLTLSGNTALNLPTAGTLARLEDLANPTAQVGPVAVNGVALTFMRSDAAPAINLGASYTWTAAHIFTNSVRTGAFGSNGAAAQTSVASGAAVPTTAATNAAPFGYTTAAQADRIVSLLNTIQAALIANGILS